MLEYKCIIYGLIYLDRRKSKMQNYFNKVVFGRQDDKK
jgi:hypothetical protein